jgi:acyl carrier protein
MEPELALAALGLALSAKIPVLAATPIHRARLAEASTGMRSPGLFAKLISARTETAVKSDSPLGKRLSEASSDEERIELMETHLKEQISRVLRLAAVRIERTRPLGQMGLDSLMGVELVNRLRSTLGLALPTTAVFNHPTVAKLASHLLEKLGFNSVEQVMQAPEPIKAGTPARCFEDLKNVSEAEALETLMSARTART